MSAFAADHHARTAAADGSGLLPDDPEPGCQKQIETSAIGAERVKPTSAGIDRVGLDRGGPMPSGVLYSGMDELRSISAEGVSRGRPWTVRAVTSTMAPPGGMKRRHLPMPLYKT